MADELNLNFEAGSPGTNEAWVEAQRLVAAKLGGYETFSREMTERFSGPRSMGQESVLYLLFLVDALITISETLVRIATDEDYEGVLEQVKGDHQALLAMLDIARDRMMGRDG